MRTKRDACATGGAGSGGEPGAEVEPAGVMPLAAAEAPVPLAVPEAHPPLAAAEAHQLLGAGEAHLWSARPAAFADPARLGRLRAMLTDEECARADRYRLAGDRRASLVTRALVRVTLSRYGDVPPDRWRFRTNDHGRPEVASPATPLRFNVSHTDGLVVCLVGRGRELGVDAESLRRDRRWLDIAERYFAPAEARALRGVPAARRRRRFLEYWTLKESYVKARGRGLTLPLSGFWFDLPAPAEDDIRVRFTPAVDDDTGRWRFTLRRVGPDHVVATAIDRTGTAPVRVTHFEAEAFGGEGPRLVAKAARRAGGGETPG